MHRGLRGLVTGTMMAWVWMSACGVSDETTDPLEPEPVVFAAERRFILPPEFPSGRPYTPGVLAGKTLYIAGQVSLDPKTREQPDGIEAQTRMAMDNVGHVLREAGQDYGNLVSCHVQLTDMEDYAAMNKVYGGYFETGRYPARTTLEMPGLAGGSRLEITCIAYSDRQQIQAVTPTEGSIPPALGPYSPAVWAGDTLYLSGQGGVDPKTKKVVEAVQEQAAQTLANITQILKAAELAPRDAAFVNAYYLGPENLGKLDTVWNQFFELGTAPARGSFCLSRLPGGISAEITFIARRGERRRITAGGDQGDALAVLSGDTLYLSAQSAPQAGANLEAQFRGLMEKLRQSLREAGLDFRHVVNANVYLKDLSQFEEMNKLFVEFFPRNPPARTTVQVREEADREPVLVEVALIAAR